ncbi:hypothetical protein HanRHA438_Chr03g0133831 [Helianthus annuus]|nr:hypothetical protein HanIR_Chr03g0133281 [Helianthus annuus]KAJ0936678.1 hypothetical protein HanRHA438_Chr03g0133831 [Helianthus annuus]
MTKCWYLYQTQVVWSKDQTDWSIDHLSIIQLSKDTHIPRMMPYPSRSIFNLRWISFELIEGYTILRCLILRHQH